jgi:hypothetical protein
MNFSLPRVLQIMVKGAMCGQLNTVHLEYPVVRYCFTCNDDATRVSAGVYFSCQTMHCSTSIALVTVAWPSVVYVEIATSQHCVLPTCKHHA